MMRLGVSQQRNLGLNATATEAHIHTSVLCGAHGNVMMVKQCNLNENQSETLELLSFREKKREKKICNLNSKRFPVRVNEKRVSLMV